MIDLRTFRALTGGAARVMRCKGGHAAMLYIIYIYISISLYMYLNYL